MNQKKSTYKMVDQYSYNFTCIERNIEVSIKWVLVWTIHKSHQNKTELGYLVSIHKTRPSWICGCASPMGECGWHEQQSEGTVWRSWCCFGLCFQGSTRTSPNMQVSNKWHLSRTYYYTDRAKGSNLRLRRANIFLQGGSESWRTE